jgi:hypothetical protein
MVFQTLVSIYYWIAFYLCPSYITGLKYKTSNNMNYRDDEEMLKQMEKDEYEDKFNLYMNNEEEQIKPLIKSKTEIFKNYSCGYCAREIIIPQYMYNDQVFCTTRCRSNLIQRKENYKMKGQSVSFSL